MKATYPVDEGMISGAIRRFLAAELEERDDLATHLLDLVDRWDRERLGDWPEVIVYLLPSEDPDDPDAQEPALVCPYDDDSCSEFWEIDRSERWNPVELREENGLYLAWREGSDGDGYASVGWLCQGCRRRVSMPDWLEVVYG